MTTDHKLKKVTTSALDLRIEDHLKEFHNLGRRLLTQAWSIGALLNERKSRTHHGDWLPYLERLGLPVRMAQRFMRIASQFTIEELGQHQTIESAERAIAAPKCDESSHLNPDTEAVLRQRVAELEDKVEDCGEKVLLSDPHFAKAKFSALEEENRVIRLQIDEWKRRYEETKRERIALQMAAGVA